MLQTLVRRQSHGAVSVVLAKLPLLIFEHGLLAPGYSFGMVSKSFQCLLTLFFLCVLFLCAGVYFLNFSDVSSIIYEVTLGKLSDVRASNLYHAGLFAVIKASDVTINLFLFGLYVRLLWVFLWQVAWMAVLSVQACTFWFAEIYTDKGTD